jgi:hypothetical protein
LHKFLIRTVEEDCLSLAHLRNVPADKGKGMRWRWRQRERKEGNKGILIRIKTAQYSSRLDNVWTYIQRIVWNYGHQKERLKKKKILLELKTKITWTHFCNGELQHRESHYPCTTFNSSAMLRLSENRIASTTAVGQPATRSRARQYGRAPLSAWFV